MLLNLNDDEFLEDPAEPAVIDAVRSLDRDTFAVLARKEAPSYAEGVNTS